MNIFEDYKNELSIVDLSNPEFKKAGKIMDWRNYVPSDWQKKWAEFSERERKIIYVMAEKEANSEEWD